MGAVLERYDRRVGDGRLDPDPAQYEVAARLDRMAEKLADARGFLGRRRKVTGLYLWGGVGRGKSMLMDLFFDAAPVKAKKRIHFHDFMQGVQDEIAEQRKTGTDDPITPVAKAIAEEAQLLCFDEFQVTNITDAMILKRLFETIFGRKTVVVATSNRVPDDLYKNGLNRQLFLPFIDLLKSEMDVFHLEAARDYRLERLTEAPVWYTPLGHEARAMLDKAWTRLTLNADPHPLSLRVKGRTLTFSCAAAGVIRSDFDQLCRQPLGAGDYLALAAQTHTLILDGIPKLTPDNRNEAIRFTTLIDALYEARAKLIAAADAEPDALYTSGTGSFEFERTASRLYEMRSVDYLGAERQEVDVPDAADAAST